MTAKRILVVFGEEGMRGGRKVGAVDEKLMRRQAATIGKILEAKRKGYAIASHLSDAEARNLQGVWEFLHAIMDEFRERA